MQGKSDRRRSERLGCRFRCELSNGKKPLQGMVRNVSQGGLSIQLTEAIEQGETVVIALYPEDREPAVDVEGIAWHAREARGRHQGQRFHLLGLVLSKASDDYLDMLQKLRASKATATPSRKRTRASSEVNPESHPAAAERRYRIRVQQPGSPRTRSIVVFAESTAAARVNALAEIGDGWNILAILPR